MPVDYSKWDKLDCSDDSDDEKQKKPTVVKTTPAAPAPAPKIAPPQKAAGSAWNSSNYHWEEQKLDVWGKQRLKDIFSKDKVSHRLDFNGAEIEITFSLDAFSVEGDVWTHIRKGNSVVGYNLELGISVKGKAKTSGGREEPLGMDVRGDLMVDDEIDWQIEWSAGGDLPFSKDVKNVVMARINELIASFLKDLEAKAHEKKATKASAETAGGGSPSAPNATVQPKSHFGGRVQVGGHQPGGLKLES
eukprot:CAMPEP_0177699206 /NCGR_PEP_ID=MMETSP0484_2-20121128/5461_1 /TAXON_ID=354590 /ORGANISM="Rhodomonas lens, Strain RHODO" /LENGTH=246 /DNA_ID=CAMNT_0019210371 /DNA_START=65 /DNA_END=805 /DNA_ORIENTATION=+